jgi:anti-sigma factor RsiW
MTTMEHSVAPEDVMALLDGELPVAEAQVVSAHLEQCAQCAMLAEELRGTSRSLSRWSVPVVPTELQDAVMSAAAKASVGRAIVKRSGWFPGGLRNWKLLVSGGAVALALLALVVFSPNQNHSAERRLARMVTSTDGNLQAQRFDDKRRVAEPLYDRAQKASAGVAGMSGVGAVMGGILPTPAPMIARTVSLTIVVKDVDAARASLDSILAQHRGYSAQLNTIRTENGPRSLQSSLRIPADELQSAVAAIKMLGRMETESQSGEEVSQQHADLVARLKTARETEERFRDILQQRTGKVSDVLEVEQSIARVRGEIEGMEAEQKALEHRVDFASVEVQLREEYKARFDSPAASVSTRMHNAFVAGYQNATESLLGFVLFVEEYGPSLLLWLAILGLPVVLAWRRYKRIRSSI